MTARLVIDEIYTPEALTEIDFDFSSSDSEDEIITIENGVREILRGRLWIDTDPGAAFSEWLTLTFYNKSAKTGEDALFRLEGKMVYTELEVATTGSDANIIPDDHSDFNPDDLIYFIDGGSSEYIRLITIADTMVAEDNPAAHAINTGISRVIEFGGFSAFNMEDGEDIYCRISFGSAQTISMKLELIVRT